MVGVLGIGLLLGPCLMAQPATCYSLSLSEHFNEHELIVPDFQTCLTYHDRYGAADHLIISCHDQYGRVVGEYRMAKTLGANEVPLDLHQLGVARTDARYTLSFINERGQRYRIPFRVQVSENTQPTVNIEADAVMMDCEASQGNLVHYYGTITGGKAPYQARWTVVDDSGQDLYQPREDHIAKKGQTPTVTVESTPTYYVALEVKDACGETAQQVVNVQCDGVLEKSNTLFVKSIRPKQTTTP